MLKLLEAAIIVLIILDFFIPSTFLDEDLSPGSGRRSGGWSRCVCHPDRESVWKGGRQDTEKDVKRERERERGRH